MKKHNNRINSDWQFRCAPLPAGYAERYKETIMEEKKDLTAPCDWTASIANFTRAI